MENNRKVTLSISDSQSVELPVMSGTLGPDVVDIRPFAKTGMFTFVPGFLATASCESRITFIDGDEGKLYYRGYPIEQLAEHSDYLESCYLLLNGELPTAEQKREFDRKILRHNMINDQMFTIFKGFRRDAHPMAVMVGVVGALSAFYHDSLDITDPHHREVSAHRLIAKIANIAAQAYRYNKGLPFSYPKNGLTYA